MIIINLSNPITIGESRYDALEIEPLSAGAALDAAVAAEVVRLDGKGRPVVIYSPALGVAERARRQVVRLTSATGAELNGPLQMSDLRKLSEADLEQLYLGADQASRLHLDHQGDPSGGREEPDSGLGDRGAEQDNHGSAKTAV